MSSERANIVQTMKSAVASATCLFVNNERYCIKGVLKGSRDKD